VTHLNRSLPQTETEYCLRIIVYYVKDRRFDNVQNVETYLTYHRHKLIDLTHKMIRRDFLSFGLFGHHRVFIKFISYITEIGTDSAV
jgi:hypothetical protein